MQAIDPNTGLPVAQLPPKPEWISPDWQDPNKVLPEVRFDGLPVSEVARYLRDQFRSDFDIVTADGEIPNEQMAISQYQLKLQLKNVKASEIFRAMNWLFESENAPIRWELKMNGTRPTALLRVEPELVPPPKPKPEPKRMVFFVGDLIGNEKSGGMTMDHIVKTISQVWNTAYSEPTKIQFYEPAQLVIVTGTPDQIDFIRQTIEALEQRVEFARPKTAAEQKMENQIKEMRLLQQTLKAGGGGGGSGSN
ncbi:MAG: hypothetical protein KGJ60_11785 [Verrucomicrobiota bacterium]|nr:hypothetical protein [Verrucomicrobiota bacterium]